MSNQIKIYPPNYVKKSKIQKRVSYGRILIDETRLGRNFQYHATKGIRVYRSVD